MRFVRSTPRWFATVAAVAILMAVLSPTVSAAASGTPHAASTPHGPAGSGCFLVIEYNYGVSYYCVNTHGYNGINTPLYDVEFIAVSTCTNAYWFVYHTSETSPGYKVSLGQNNYNGYLYKLTQVDVTGWSCTP